jgi:hypothetical protein
VRVSELRQGPHLLFQLARGELQVGRIVAGEDLLEACAALEVEKGQARVGDRAQPVAQARLDLLAAVAPLGLQQDRRGAAAQVAAAARARARAERRDRRADLGEDIDDIGVLAEQLGDAPRDRLHVVGRGARRALDVHVDEVGVAGRLEALRQEREQPHRADEHH